MLGRFGIFLIFLEITYTSYIVVYMLDYQYDTGCM